MVNKINFNNKPWHVHCILAIIISHFRNELKMLNSHKNTTQLNSIFSAYELHEIMLQGTDTSYVDFELDDLVEVSDEAVEIDEMQIGKLYLCL